MLTLLMLIATATAGPTCANTTKLTAESASFTDGSAAKALYKANAKDCWDINPQCPGDGALSLHFTRMDLERAYDWVQVFDARGQLLTKSAGTSTTFHSTSLTVWFSSDESDERTGFQASYSCDTLSEDDEEAAPEEADADESLEDSKETAKRAAS